MFKCSCFHLHVTFLEKNIFNFPDTFFGVSSCASCLNCLFSDLQATPGWLFLGLIIHFCALLCVNFLHNSFCFESSLARSQLWLLKFSTRFCSHINEEDWQTQASRWSTNSSYYPLMLFNLNNNQLTNITEKVCFHSLISKQVSKEIVHSWLLLWGLFHIWSTFQSSPNGFLLWFAVWVICQTDHVLEMICIEFRLGHRIWSIVIVVDSCCCFGWFDCFLVLPALFLLLRLPTEKGPSFQTVSIFLLVHLWSARCCSVVFLFLGHHFFLLFSANLHGRTFSGSFPGHPPSTHSARCLSKLFFPFANRFFCFCWRFFFRHWLNKFEAFPIITSRMVSWYYFSSAARLDILVTPLWVALLVGHISSVCCFSDLVITSGPARIVLPPDTNLLCMKKPLLCCSVLKLLLFRFTYPVLPVRFEWWELVCVFGRFGHTS